MDFYGKRIGFALTGSHCTYDAVLPEIKKLVELGAEVVPVVTYTVRSTNTKFGDGDDWLENDYVEYLMNFLISLLFYATPIVYTVDLFPESVRWILYLNPMTHFIDAYRSIFYYQTTPSLMSILYISLFAVFFLVFGYMIFRKLEKGFAEEV